MVDRRPTLEAVHGRSVARSPNRGSAPGYGAAVPGVAHLAAFVAAVPAGVALVLYARDGVAQLGALVFAASVSMMLGVSSLFHRRD